MRRLICTFVVRIWHKTGFLMTWLTCNRLSFHFCFLACPTIIGFIPVWKIASHDQTNKMVCAPSEDSDQPGHPPSLIRVFTVYMKKCWVLSYQLSAQLRLWSDCVDLSLAGCTYHLSRAVRKCVMSYANNKGADRVRARIFLSFANLFFLVPISLNLGHLSQVI